MNLLLFLLFFFFFNLRTDTRQHEMAGLEDKYVINKEKQKEQKEQKKNTIKERKSDQLNIKMGGFSSCT